jgi:FAD/FMN-containing dehydrogenase
VEIHPSNAKTCLISSTRSSTCWLPAAGFFKLQNSIEVALALRIVNHFQAVFSIRGAGHNANPGFSSAEGYGVVLDLSGLNDIVLSPEKETVSVGPGATWDRVYKQLEDHELTVVGGRAAGVGVGGLLTGGKYSFQFGVCCKDIPSHG